MKFVVFVSILFVLLCSPIAAQENKCELKLSQIKNADTFFGFYLGMSIDSVRELVPTLKTGKTDKFGLMKTSFSPRFDPKIEKTKFENVRTVSFEFLDDKLVDLWIGYTAEFKWQTIEEFLPQMSASLGLPVNGWQTKELERRLECKEFRVVMMTIANSPSIRLTDLISKKLWETRRTEKAEQ